ncbi:hypothetical protein F5Y15DRAFT_382849 [Xylariaceae sp. FL0016]|nr:hypothetical protein F5Y15DRAFT_382849 [Xylariaceae sp. FL0016]
MRALRGLRAVRKWRGLGFLAMLCKYQHVAMSQASKRGLHKLFLHINKRARFDRISDLVSCHLKPGSSGARHKRNVVRCEAGH